MKYSAKYHQAGAEVPTVVFSDRLINIMCKVLISSATVYFGGHILYAVMAGRL